MTREYILAVDGGATKTHALVMHLPTTHIWMYEGGPASHEALAGGFDELPFVLRRHINGALANANINREDIAYAVFGLAGVDFPYQHEKICGILNKLGLADYTLTNDAFLPILAASPTGKGIGAINGTGFSVAGIDGEGTRVQLGGFHHMSDDFGGGEWYAQQAVAAVYRSLYKGARATLLLDNLLEAFDMHVAQRYQLMEVISQKMLENSAETIKQLCMCLHQAGNAGDLTARGILEKSATEYAICIGNILNRYQFADMGEVPVILCGTQFVKGSKVLRWVLQELLPAECALHVLDAPPVLGALYEGLRAVKFDITEDFRAYAAQVCRGSMRE